MKDEMFNELLESVQQADAIMRGKARSSRVFEFPNPEMRTIRVIAPDCLGTSSLC
jgi:putative transcriptional regulator